MADGCALGLWSVVLWSMLLDGGDGKWSVVCLRPVRSCTSNCVQRYAISINWAKELSIILTETERVSDRKGINS